MLRKKLVRESDQIDATVSCLLQHVSRVNLAENLISRYLIYFELAEQHVN